MSHGTSLIEPIWILQSTSRRVANPTINSNAGQAPPWLARIHFHFTQKFVYLFSKFWNVTLADAFMLHPGGLQLSPISLLLPIENENQNIIINVNSKMNITQPRMKTNVCSKQTAARIELPAPYNQCKQYSSDLFRSV